MPDHFLSPLRGLSNRDSNSGRETRIIRERMESRARSLDRQTGQSQSYSSARILVQVFNAGSIPATVPAVYFTHPVLVTGSETEGGAGTLTIDTATTVPVVVLGSVPSVGDYLAAYAVGGRWVAERWGLGSGTITCSPCNIPAEDLIITWTNAFTGTGWATMARTTSSNLWATGCVADGLQFQLGCNRGSIELRAIFPVSGVCPTGTSNYCSNLRDSPLALTFSDHTCLPFSLTYTVAESACPSIYSTGTTQFVITL